MAWDQSTLNQYAADAKNLGWEQDGGKKIYDWAKSNNVGYGQVADALNSAYGGNRDAGWVDSYIKQQGWEGWGQQAQPAQPAAQPQYAPMPQAPQYQAPQFTPVQAAQVQGLGIDYKPAMQGLLGGQVNNPYLNQIAGNIADQAWQGYNRGTAGQIRDQFQVSSQYGSNRQGIAEGIAMGDLNRGIADSLSNLYGGAYENAQGRQAQMAQALAGYDAQANMANAQLQQEAALANSGRDVDVWKAQTGFNLQGQGLANDWALGQAGLGIQQGNLDLARLTQGQNFDLGNRQLSQQGRLADQDFGLRQTTQAQNFDLGNRTLAQQGALANRGYDIQQTGQNQQFDLGNRTLAQEGLLGNRRIDNDKYLGELNAQTQQAGFGLQAQMNSERMANERYQFEQNQLRQATQDMRNAQFDPLIYDTMLLDLGDRYSRYQQSLINADLQAYDYNANEDYRRARDNYNTIAGNSGAGNSTTTTPYQGVSPAAAGMGGAMAGWQMGSNFGNSMGRQGGGGYYYYPNGRPIGGPISDPDYG